eukprot:scaffold40_cov85-Skeletonema_marinoi.AAC.4
MQERRMYKYCSERRSVHEAWIVKGQTQTMHKLRSERRSVHEGSKLSKEECAEGIVQRSSCAAQRDDAQVKLGMEECAIDTGAMV